MRAEAINRVSGIALIVLSVTAFVTVLFGYTTEPLPDEGTLAHIFQLTIVACVAAFVVFVATADWQQPFRRARTLVIPAVALVLAFGALYYLEHHYWVAVAP